MKDPGFDRIGLHEQHTDDRDRDAHPQATGQEADNSARSRGFLMIAGRRPAASSSRPP
jgi:hypothetical protein